VLHPNKDGTVQDLLDEARKQVELNPAGSGKLRSVCTNLRVLKFCKISSCEMTAAYRRLIAFGFVRLSLLVGSRLLCKEKPW